MHLSLTLISKKWFTLVELIVGMTIFSIGMTAILALLDTTINTAILSRHEIVVSNLLREQIELVKNTRNSNLLSYAKWDTALIDDSSATRFYSGNFLIENNFTTPLALRNSTTGNLTKSPISLRELTTSITATTPLSEIYTMTRLYLDDQGRYTHTPTPDPTRYASYIRVSPLVITETDPDIAPEKDGTPQWYILDARVISETHGRYREFDLKTVITDWQK